LTAGLVLGAFEDDLDAIAFLCHFSKVLTKPANRVSGLQMY
jgi:hypothetical protein